VSAKIADSSLVVEPAADVSNLVSWRSGIPG
jgi:hypothetical protein